MRDTRLSCKYFSGGNCDFDAEKIFEIIQSEISCEEMRRLIFGSKMNELSDVEYLMDRRKMMFSAIGNIFWLGGIFAYFDHFRRIDCGLSGDDVDDGTRTYSERLSQIFGTVYNGENMSLDKALSAFTEMQILVHSDPRRSPYAEMIVDYDDCGEYNIAEIGTYVKVWEADAVLVDDIDYKELQQLLIDTIYIFRFLSGLKLVLDGARINFVFEDEKIDTYGCLWKLNGKYYYLYDAQQREDRCRCLLRCFNYRYYNLNARKHKADIEAIGIDDAFCNEIIGCVSENFPKIKKHFGDATQNCQFLKINFGYIYKLAISLCDMMKLAEKEYFKKMFEKGCAELFEQAFDKKTGSYNWEQLVTMVLIDCGPSAVLDCVVSGDRDFKVLLENLNVRLPYRINVEKNVKKLAEIQKKELDFLSKLFPARGAGDQLYRENADKVMCNARTRLLIDILSERGEPEEDNIEKISVREKFFDMYAESHSVLDSEKIRYTYQIFDDLFYALDCFYVGCIEYAHERNTIERKNEFDRLDPMKKDGKENYAGKNCDTAEAVADRYKAYQDAFMKAAEEIAPYVRKQTLKTKIEIFKYICSHFVYASSAALNDVAVVLGDDKEEIMFSDILKKVLGQTIGDGGETDTVHKNRELLQRLIGRKKICSIKELNSILDFGNGVDFFNYEQKTDCTQNGKFFGSPFYKAAKTLFTFLDYNNGYKEEKNEKMLIDNNDPIFPYVVKCKIKNAHSDGYRFGNYNIMLKDDGNAASRKLLSEYEYEINKTYYCIPNASMSNHLCWIEPFMIDAREFTRRINSDTTKQ